MVYLTVAEGNLEDPNEINKRICFKRNILPTTCKKSNTVDIVKRSIESPLSAIFKKSESKRIIRCDDKNLIINVIKAEVSNNDKSICKSDLDLTNSVECTDKIFSTILATKACNGKNQCDISIDDTFGFVCECSLQKYLDITYKCVEKLDTEIEAVRVKRRLAYNLKSKQRDESTKSKYKRKMQQNIKKYTKMAKKNAKKNMNNKMESKKNDLPKKKYYRQKNNNYLSEENDAVKKRQKRYIGMKFDLNQNKPRSQRTKVKDYFNYEDEYYNYDEGDYYDEYADEYYNYDEGDYYDEYADEYF